MTRFLPVFFAAFILSNPAFATTLVSGKATLEKRSTVIPLTICEAEPCPRPQSYWTLVIATPEQRFEVDEIFNLGAEEAPIVIQLMGEQIRPGVNVSVEGQVEMVSQSYGFIYEVKKAKVHDVRAFGEEQNDEAAAGFSTGAFGWRCRTPDNIEWPIYVDVYMSGRTDDHETFQINVLGSKPSEGEPTFYPIASVDKATVAANDSRIVYAGESGTANIQLDIQRVPGRSALLPAVLSLSHGDWGKWRPSVEKRYTLSCIRTRL